MAVVESVHPLEKRLQRYDGTAQRLGYKQHKDNDWYKVPSS